MTKLDCSVKNCVHNSDNCCCKEAIVVDGWNVAKPAAEASPKMMEECLRTCLRHRKRV